MKRVSSIVWLILGLASALYSQKGGDGGIGGHIRYEHQYQEVSVNDNLLISLRRAPSVDLRKSGFISSKYFLAYTLRTALSTTFQTSRYSTERNDSRQFHWNEYDVNFLFFQKSPVTIQLASREYTTDVRYDYGALDTRSGTRDREHRVNFSVTRVPFLPLINLAYRTNRSWSIVNAPYEQKSEQFSFSAATRNGSEASANVSGSLSSFRERFTGISERILTVQFNGTRQFSERHAISLGSEFNKYGTYSALSGGLSYGGAISRKLRINSGLRGQNSSGRSYSFRSVSTTQSASLVLDEHFRGGVNLSAGTGIAVSDIRGDRRRVPNHNWIGSFNLSHSRQTALFQTSNNISMSYGGRVSGNRLTFWRFGLSNTIQRSVGLFDLKGTYNFSTLLNKNGTDWSATNNYVEGEGSARLPQGIRSRTSLDYRSYTYGGDGPKSANRHTLNFKQHLTGKFNYVIPFSLGLGGSVHWYYAFLRGRTYGWNITFASPHFFLKSLYANYLYRRSYDPYYDKESREQTASFTYRWRSLNFQLHLREMKLFSTQREVRFMVERAL